jgi:undecaprenyl-diphosphatase
VSELEAAFLGLVQGLTEFLPVSSSGHLVMAQTVLGVGEEGLLFEIAVHIATLASVVIFYWRRILQLVQGLIRGQRNAIEYAAKLVVATIPAVLAVLLLGDFLDAQFDSPAVAGVCLLVTGGLLFTTRYTAERATLEAPSFGAALAIGCAQAFAILPGISRSGSTVAMALALGVRPVVAAEFSFLMSIIAITGAAVRSLPDLTSVGAGKLAPLLVGGGFAMVSGIAAIWLFVRLLRTQGFHHVAWYTWAAGLLFLGWLRLS